MFSPSAFDTELAESILAVEAMHEHGTLTAALETLRLRQQTKSDGSGSTGQVVGTMVATQPDADTSAGIGKVTTLVFPSFVGNTGVTYGPENDKTPLPTGTQSVEEWGLRVVTFGKLSGTGLTYSEVLNHDEHCEYVKWVFDHVGNIKWSNEMRDFGSYLVRMNLKYTIAKKK